MATSHGSAILIVNDHEPDLLALREALLPLGEPILAAESAAEGLRLAEENEIAVAVVDIRMPAVDGFGMVETLRGDPERRDLPIIFVTALDVTPEVVKRVYALGAADVVSLPIMPEMLRSKVSVFVRLHRQAARERAYAIEVRQAAASEVHTQQERFRLLIESVSDYALFFLDPLGLVSEWTASAERLLGYPDAEIVGQPFKVLFTPEDRAKGAPEAELEQALTQGQARDDTQHLRRDGSRVPVHGRTIALRDDQGMLRGFAKIMRDATQLQALRESEAKYREIFETANEGIWILNAGSVIEVANRRIAEMLGHEVRELVGRRKSEFVFPEDQPYIAQLLEERRSGKVQAAIEVRFRHKNGTAVWTLMSARPIFRDGKFAGALDMFTDITPRRLAEDRFRVFFESSAAGHALVDPATRRFVQVNRRYCEIAGRSEAELRQLTFDDITHPDDRRADSDRFRDLYAGRTHEVITEKRYVQPDGAIVWVQLTTTLVRTPDGQPEAQVSVVQDITERKMAELELAESRTRLRLAVEIADLGVFYLEGRSGVMRWSPQMKTLLGMTEDEPASVEVFLGRVHPEDRPRVKATLDRMFAATAEAVETEMEYRVVWPDGTIRWLKAHGVSNVHEGAQEFQLIGTVRDITAEKEFAGELARRIAERTQELDDKNRQLESFAYTVAHDLRAPLRAINGYADYALEDIAGLGRPQAQDFLERIRGSTQRLDALVSDLLSYSRINQVTVAADRVELQLVVQTVLRELEPEIKRTGARVTVHPSMPAARGDPSVLEQVVLNLVGNALKFAPKGQPPEVDISATDGDGHVRLCIRDHGIGIPPEYHDRIFRVFERLQSSRAYPGTGIGLAIVARGMERMGGQYGVESEPGRGSTFWIELKATRDERTAPDHPDRGR